MQIKNFHVYDETNKAVQEAYSLLTANIHFSNNSNNIKTVSLVSCMPDVGKTTIAINLAITMAKSGWNTLFVDTDMRKPGNVKKISNEKIIGLSDIIEGKSNINDAIVSTNIPNFSYLSCGQNNDNPIEILCSTHFKEFVKNIKEKYDFVIFDTPTLSSVIDGALIASETDGTLLIAQMGATKLTTLNRSKEQLEKANVKILGVVLNKVKKRDYQKYVQTYNYFFDISRFERKTKQKRSAKA